VTAFGATALPLAAVHDVALLDLDGVVYVGPDAVPHAAASLDRALASHGMRAGFVTNNAARPPAVVAEHLRALGVRAQDADVVTSAQAAARVVAEQLPRGARVLAVGGPGVAWALEERGLVPVRSSDEGPLAVVQGFGPEVGWRELAEATLALHAGARYVATNRDRTIPTPRGRVLGNGAMVAAVEHATGVVPVVAGKPEPPLMVESVERMRAVRPLVVGDRLDTDIEGATRAGIPSLLVLTGVSDWHDLLAAAPPHRPTYLDHDLRALLEPAPMVAVAREGAALVVRCRDAMVRLSVAAAGAGATAQGQVADGRSGSIAPAWLPEAWRERGVSQLDGAAPSGAQLDLVRCLVSAAWTLVDEGLVATGPATVQPG
jgi:HAD superfamily hydrolase (TIGR01450 family)